MTQFAADEQFVLKRWKPVQLGGWRTFIFDEGAGLPLVFTPIAQNIEVFHSPLMQHYAGRFRVITYQRRESTSEYLEAWDRASDLKLVLDDLGIDSAHFISHSSGAIATAHFALAHPEVVQSLVLMNWCAYYPHLQGWRTVLNDKIAPLLPSKLVLWFFIPYMARRGTPEYHHIYQQFNKFDQLQLHLKYSINRIVQTHDIRSDLHRIRAPILLINRDDDYIVPMKEMEYLAQHLPNCYGLKVVHGGGHFFHYTFPEAMVGFIDQFYSEIGIDDRETCLRE